MVTLKNMGLAFVFLWFMVGGIAHFTKTDLFVAIMPPYIGFHRKIKVYRYKLETNIRRRSAAGISRHPVAF
jgi:uncharacterized membrane protein